MRLGVLVAVIGVVFVGSGLLQGDMPQLAAAQAQTSSGEPGRFTGPGSCSSSSCHGSVRPRTETRILQNEYSIWVVKDKHSRAFAVLSNPVGVRMTRILGLARAETEPKCLACHALNAAGDERGRTFDLSDGVSCESCHGPAAAWLGPHTTRNWTHKQSVQKGMYDTRDLVKRAEKCLSCHLGNQEKFVDHEMLAAGHPDLFFELDSFSAVMPRHWKEPTEEGSSALAALPAAETAATGQIVIGSTGQQINVQVEGNGRLAYTASHLRNPERLVLDFAGVRLARTQNAIRSDVKPVSRIRLGQFKPDVARVVIELEREVPYSVKAEGRAVSVEFGGAVAVAATPPAAASLVASKTFVGQEMEADTPHPRDAWWGVREWGSGQAVQLRDALRRLSGRARGKVWPEYTELQCEACHHSLPKPEQSWRQERGYPKRRPGDAPWNASRYVVFRHLIRQVDPEADKQLEAQLTRLAELMGRLNPDREAVASAATASAELADRLARRMASLPYDQALTMRLLRAISGDADQISAQGERAAEQAVMALESLFLAYNRNAKLGNYAEIRAAIDALFQQLQNISDYNAPLFARQMLRVESLLR